MSDVTPDRVDALAVETAIQIVKSLDGKQEISPEELTALRTEVGATGLLLGFSSIVLSLVRLIDDHPEEFTFTDSIGIDQRVTGSSLIPAVLTSLSKKRECGSETCPRPPVHSPLQRSASHPPSGVSFSARSPRRSSRPGRGWPGSCPR